MRVSLQVSIGTTISGAFLAMGLLLAVLGGYGLYVLGAAGGFVVQLYDRPLMALNFDRAASLDFAQMDKELLRRAHAPQRDWEAIDAKIEHLANTFREDLAVAAERSLYADETKVIEQIGALVAQWHQMRHELRGAASNPADNPVPREELDRVAEQVVDRFEMLAELANGHSFVERRKVITEITFFKYSSLAAIVLALLIAGGITLSLVHRIIRPLRDAASVADRIAEGEFEASIPTGRPDETGQLLRSMAVMQQNIRDMVER